MPLTDFQAKITILLAQNRSEDSYLAGGAALHLDPNTTRFSNDLDYFHDSEERVASAFAEDKHLLEREMFSVRIEMSQPGYIRAQVSKTSKATKLEWARDSAWRFLPVSKDKRVGFVLNPIDLAINKVLALVGRNEPRDVLDTLDAHEKILPLGGLLWAAAGKDPGYTPLGLLDLIRRRGSVRPEELRRLHTREDIDAVFLKSKWHGALEVATEFVSAMPAREIGCLYYCDESKEFIADGSRKGLICHYGRPGGVLPRAID